MNQLKIIQKKCMRIIFNSKYNAHTSRFFQFAKICKVENIFQRDSLNLAYKYHDRALPNAIMNLFNKSIFEPINTAKRNLLNV